MAENFPNLKEETDIQVQKAWWGGGSNQDEKIKKWIKYKDIS